MVDHEYYASNYASKDQPQAANLRHDRFAAERELAGNMDEVSEGRTKTPNVASRMMFTMNKKGIMKPNHITMTMTISGFQQRLIRRKKNS